MTVTLSDMRTYDLKRYDEVPPVVWTELFWHKRFVCVNHPDLVYTSKDPRSRHTFLTTEGVDGCSCPLDDLRVLVDQATGLPDGTPEESAARQHGEIGPRVGTEVGTTGHIIVGCTTTFTGGRRQYVVITVRSDTRGTEYNVAMVQPSAVAPFGLVRYWDSGHYYGGGIPGQGALDAWAEFVRLASGDAFDGLREAIERRAQQ